MALECLKIVLKMQNFPGLRPWTPLGGLTAPPKKPQLYWTRFARMTRFARITRFARKTRYARMTRFARDLCCAQRRS